MINLAKALKEFMDEQARFPAWNKHDNIKSALKIVLFILLDEYGYPPPVEQDEVYEDIFTLAGILRRTDFDY